MACVKCGSKKAEISLPHLPGKMCERCLAEIVEKRVRADVRRGNYFWEKRKILVLDDGSENSVVSRYFVDELTKHSGAEVKIKKIGGANLLGREEMAALAKKEKAERIVVPTNTEQESERLLKEISSSGGYAKENPKVVRLLKHVSSAEIKIFAKLKGLDYNREADHYDKRWGELISKLEKESPDVRFALLRSFERL